VVEHQGLFKNYAFFYGTTTEEALTTHRPNGQGLQSKRSLSE
jgi:hypothetical protein